MANRAHKEYRARKENRVPKVIQALKARLDHRVNQVLLELRVILEKKENRVHKVSKVFRAKLVHKDQLVLRDPLDRKGLHSHMQTLLKNNLLH